MLRLAMGDACVNRAVEGFKVDASECIVLKSSPGGRSRVIVASGRLRRWDRTGIYRSQGPQILTPACAVLGIYVSPQFGYGVSVWFLVVANILLRKRRFRSNEIGALVVPHDDTPRCRS